MYRNDGQSSMLKPSNMPLSHIEEYLDDSPDRWIAKDGYFAYEGKSANTVLIET